MRVLVIEDSPSYRQRVVEVFRDIGLRTVAVESGEQALNELQASRYDLVCLDLHLPEMDRLDVQQSCSTDDALGVFLERKFELVVSDIVLEGRLIRRFTRPSKTDATG